MKKSLIMAAALVSFVATSSNAETMPMNNKSYSPMGMSFEEGRGYNYETHESFGRYPKQNKGMNNKNYSQMGISFEEGKGYNYETHENFGRYQK